MFTPETITGFIQSTTFGLSPSQKVVCLDIINSMIHELTTTENTMMPIHVVGNLISNGRHRYLSHVPIKETCPIEKWIKSRQEPLNWQEIYVTVENHDENERVIMENIKNSIPRASP